MNRHRQDRALEVVLDDPGSSAAPKLLGWLLGHDGSKLRGSVLNVAMDLPSLAVFDEEEEVPPLTYLTVSIRRLKLCFDETMFARHRTHAEIEVARRVPAYAEAVKDMAKCQVIYTWRAASVSEEGYEQLFDMDCFEPFDDGPADMEARLTTATASYAAEEARIKKVLAERIEKDMLSALSGTRPSTAIAGSTLTMEKLEKIARTLGPAPSSPSVNSFMGHPVVMSSYIPEDKAYVVGGAININPLSWSRLTKESLFA